MCLEFRPGEPEREGEAALETMNRFAGRRKERPAIRQDIWKLVLEESKLSFALKDKEVEKVMILCFGCCKKKIHLVFNKFIVGSVIKRQTIK